MLPEGWTEQSLDSLADYINGRAFKPEDWSKSGLPIIRIAQITNPNAEFDYYAGEDLNPRNLIENGDLIFSWSATLATIFWGKGRGILNQHLFKVIPNQGIDKGYLKQLIDHSIPALADHSHGSTMKHIKRSALKDFIVGVPPLPEQRIIAEILCSVDAAIEATKAVMEQTKRVKQGLLQTLLTRGIGHTEFKDSPLGEIPECWEVTSVGHVFKTGRGRVINKDEIKNNPGIYPVYSSQSFNNGEFGKIGTYDFEGEYVTWTTDGANAGTVFYRNGKFNCTNVCGTLKPIRDGEVDLRFATYFIGTIAKSYVSYVGNPKLMNNVMGTIPMLLPPLEEQARIGSAFVSIDEKIADDERFVAQLTAIKKGLMEDLLTGKVRVNQAEKVAA